jgi:hypothetical protein
LKLTWFGGTTLRIHIGGSILVADRAAIGGVELAELVSGADRVFSLRDDLPVVDARRWAPRRPPTLLAETNTPAVLVHRLEPAAVLIDAVGEPPLVLATAPLSAAGRWSTGAIIVILGPQPAVAASAALERLAPRLIAVAGNDAAVDAVLADIGDRLAGTGFMALEPALALEV